jgi:outer membrane protein
MPSSRGPRARPAARRGGRVSLLLLVLAPGVAAAQQPLAVAVRDTNRLVRDTTPSPPTGRPITLAEAIATAKQNAPAAIQARGQVRAGETAVRSARAAYIPNVQVSTGLTRQNNVTQRVNPTTGEIQSGRFQSTTGLSANVDVFDGFRRTYDLRAARAQEAAAEAGTVATGANLALQVKQQYFAALAAREAEVAAQAQLAQAEQQLALSVAKVRANTATRSDSLRGIIAVSQAQLALLGARNDRVTADAALTRVIGSSAAVSATPEGLPSDTSVAVDSASLASLAAVNPTIRQAEANLGASRAQVRAARAQYYPTVSLSYNRNLAGSQNTFDPFGANYTTSGQLRLNLSLPVFNQLAREQGIIQANIAATNAEATLRDQQLAAQQSLVNAIIALRTAQQQIVLQTQSVTAAEEDLRVQQQRYQLGVSTVLDVLTSQSQLNQARLALVQARFAIRTARAQLEALIGRDL